MDREITPHSSATLTAAPGAPSGSVTAADVSASLVLLEKTVAQVLKDRIDLRDNLEACVDLLRQAFDCAGNPFGDPDHAVIREAVKVLRRTA